MRQHVSSKHLTIHIQPFQRTLFETPLVSIKLKIPPLQLHLNLNRCVHVHQCSSCSSIAEHVEYDACSSRINVVLAQNAVVTLIVFHAIGSDHDKRINFLCICQANFCVLSENLGQLKHIECNDYYLFVAVAGNI